MKKNILTILLFVLSANIYSQNLSPEERQHWVGVLDSASYFDREWAIEKIYADSIYEAIPKLEEIFWRSDIMDRSTYLEMLQYLKAPSAHTYAQLLLDSLRLDPCPYKVEDQNLLKGAITEVLFRWGDYSTAEYVFELIDSNKGTYYIPLDLLPAIYQNVPHYSERAKNLLISIAESKDYNYANKNYSFGALWHVEKLFGEQGMEIYKNVLLSDFDYTIKIEAMEYLVKYHYPKLDSLLRASIQLEELPYIRFLFVQTILRYYCNVNNIKWVKEYISAESDMKYKDYMKVELNAGRAKPQRPNINTELNLLLDTLNQYTDECLEAGFLADNNFSIELKTRLNNARQYLASSDSLNCARQIKWYQLSVQQVYSDSAGSYPKYVSRDAYKFLYYYPQYILERLPEATEPRNDLIAKASAEITTVNGVLQYAYAVTNEAASNQTAANIYVEDTTTSAASAPVNWQTEKVQNQLDRFYTTTNQITAGSSQSGYSVTSNSLPVIGKVYVQSERFAVDTTDIKTNSYIVTTVVPSQRPAQINASAFIDSMISYNNRAYSLGWMQYYWVRDNNYYQLNNAKTMINMNVPASAVVILTAFEGWLDTCMSLSYFNKETYGLLKYNSIYLREKLSGQ